MDAPKACIVCGSSKTHSPTRKRIRYACGAHFSEADGFVPGGSKCAKARIFADEKRRAESRIGRQTVWPADPGSNRGDYDDGSPRVDPDDRDEGFKPEPGPWKWMK